MYVYGSGAWAGGYLDETPEPGRTRVSVHRQIALMPSDEQYFVRRPDLGMLVSYVRMLGLRRVVRKVVSRRQEAERNDAWLSIGLGRTDEGSVAFVLSTGPQAVERVVVPDCLTFAVPDEAVDGSRAGHFAPAEGKPLWDGVDRAVVEELATLAGWSAESGSAAEVSEPTRRALLGLLELPPTSFSPLADRPSPSEVTERYDPTPSSPAEDRPRLHCFGYGQYAKTQVIPNLGDRLELACVHEINPVQMGPIAEDATVAWDTSRWPRPGEAIDNAVVAGYHHTHAPTAVALLDQGVRHIVLEKPIVTTAAQLEDLSAALDRNPGAKVHVAFQRRYSPFNSLLLEDLEGGPVSMTAAVYEVPLPARHWYRWPVSGNAVVSNGCHWVDHFLHLNGYAEVTGLAASALSSQIVLTVDLANGASASLSLRHQGAPRKGVRDLCVYFNGEASAVVEDLTRYSAEKGYHQLRHRTTHPYRAHEEMYTELGRRIEGDLSGDDVDELRASATATLELARLVDLG